MSPDGEVQDGTALDAQTLAWVEEINSSGTAFLTPALLDGHWSVRGVDRSETDDVAELWKWMQDVVS